MSERHGETTDRRPVNTDPDRWKCPDCGKVQVDPPSVIAQCGCGSDRIQMRYSPHGPDDWEPPEWPDDSEYSGDPFDVETELLDWGAKS